MDVVDVLRRSGGVEAVAQQLGLPTALASAGAEALVPAILGGFSRISAAAGGGEPGMAALADLLDGLGGGDLAARVLLREASEVASGNRVLGEVFGSKEISRTVAGRAAAQTGIAAETLERMLPLLAMLLGGYVSARAQSGGAGAAGGLGALLGTEPNPLDAILAAPKG